MKTHKEIVKLDSIKSLIDELNKNYNYINDNGDVGCFELSEDDILEKYRTLVKILKRSNSIIGDISFSVKESIIPCSGKLHRKDTNVNHGGDDLYECDKCKDILISRTTKENNYCVR